MQVNSLMGNQVRHIDNASSERDRSTTPAEMSDSSSPMAQPMPVGTINLAALAQQSHTRIDELSIEINGVFMRLPLPAGQNGQLSLNLVPNGVGGCTLAIATEAVSIDSPSSVTLNSGELAADGRVTLRFSGGEALTINETEAETIGTLFAEIDNLSEEQSSIDLSIFKKSTFERLLALSRGQADVNSLDAESVFSLLHLADYIGNQTVKACCKDWLFSNINNQLAARNQPVFLELIAELCALPGAVWEDYSVTRELEGLYEIKDYRVTQICPGLLREIIMMALPTRSGRDQNTVSVNDFYREVMTHIQEEQALGSGTLTFPATTPGVVSFNDKLRAALSKNAKDAIQHLLASEQAGDLYQKVAEEQGKYNDYGAVCTLCAVIGNGLTTRHNAVLNNSLVSNLDAIEVLIDKVSEVVGATCVNDALASRFGGDLVKQCAVANDITGVRFLLDRGCPAHQSGGLGKACANGYTEITRTLLEAGASADEGLGLLQAIRSDQPGTAAVLLNNNPKPQLHGELYEETVTPLVEACKQGRIPMSELLLEKGADIDGVHLQRQFFEDDDSYDDYYRSETVYTWHSPILAAKDGCYGTLA